MQAFPYENLTATTTIPIQAKQRKLLSVALPFITFLQLTFDIEGVNVQLHELRLALVSIIEYGYRSVSHGALAMMVG